MPRTSGSPSPFVRAAVAAGLLAVTACSSAGASRGDGEVEVAAALYPYQFVAERVGGEHVRVRNLTAAGGEPHDLELSPRQVAELGDADLVVFSAGFQPAVDEAVEQQAPDHALDVLSAVDLRTGAGHDDAGHSDAGHDDAGHDDAGHDDPGHGEGDDEGTADPHVWLDPQRLATIGAAVADRLAEVDPEHAADYEASAAELTADLTALDDELRTGLSSCTRRQIVTSHDAFGYLAEAYGLEQVAIAGLSPDAEASPKRLAEVAEQAEAAGVTHVFFEELVSPEVAESLAREVGAEATVLSPLEGPPESGDYITGMRANLATLRTALDCR